MHGFAYARRVSDAWSCDATLPGRSSAATGQLHIHAAEGWKMNDCSPPQRGDSMAATENDANLMKI